MNKYSGFPMIKQGFALNPSILHSQVGKDPALPAALKGWGKKNRKKAQNLDPASLQHSFSFHPANGHFSGIAGGEPSSMPCSSSKPWNFPAHTKQLMVGAPSSTPRPSGVSRAGFQTSTQGRGVQWPGLFISVSIS